MNPSVATYALLTVGPHHGDEIPADAGDHKWLALVQRTEGWKLETVRVDVTPVADPVLDPPDGSVQSGRRVAVPDLGATPMLLLLGDALQPGPVATPEAGPRALFPGDQQTLTLGADADQLTLQATGQASRNAYDDIVIEAYQLQAQHASGATTLFASSPLQKRGEVPRVRFAGDLDRDGRLDLIVDTANHYNVTQLTLFLSSTATDTALAPMATFRGLGG